MVAIEHRDTIMKAGDLVRIKKSSFAWSDSIWFREAAHDKTPLLIIGLDRDIYRYERGTARHRLLHPVVGVVYVYENLLTRHGLR
jgi:hypothetical protein